MSDSTRIDVNYLSCGTADKVWGLYAGSDHAVPGTAPVDGKVLPDNPLQYASALKLCDGLQISLTGLEVAQCSECAVDINNHAFIAVEGVFGSSNIGIGNQTFSVKGGSEAYITGPLKGFGNRKCDILVDNWSDQSYNGSIVNLIDASHESGRRLVVIKRYGASTINGNNFKVDIVRSLGLTIYWWTKWIIRKMLGIKIGQKGPSWI